MTNSQPLSQTELQAYVEQTSRLIDLPISAESLPGVVDNLARMQGMAKLVMEFPLPEDVESAATFQPSFQP